MITKNFGFPALEVVFPSPAGMAQGAQGALGHPRRCLWQVALRPLHSQCGAKHNRHYFPHRAVGLGSTVRPAVVEGDGVGPWFLAGSETSSMLITTAPGTSSRRLSCLDGRGGDEELERVGVSSEREEDLARSGDGVLIAAIGPIRVGHWAPFSRVPG